MVRTWGPEDGPVLLCWHGLGFRSGLAFNELGPALAELGWRVLAPDAPGFGDSPAIAPDGYRPAALADLVPAILDALGHASCTFVGFSWGATIGCHLAVRHPDRVAALVLLDAGFADPDPLDATVTVAGLADSVRGDLAGLAAGLADVDEAVAWARTRAERFTPAVDAQWRAAFHLRGGRPVPAVTAEVLAAATVGLAAEPPSGVWRALQQGRAPILLLTATSADAVERFSAIVQQARVEAVPSPGHDVLVETPAEVCAAIDGWVRALLVSRLRDSWDTSARSKAGKRQRGSLPGQVTELESSSPGLDGRGSSRRSAARIIPRISETGH